MQLPATIMKGHFQSRSSRKSCALKMFNSSNNLILPSEISQFHCFTSFHNCHNCPSHKTQKRFHWVLRKWHPAPTVRCTPVPKPAASPAPWATAAPAAPASYCGGRAPAAPAANAQPAWMREDPQPRAQATQVYDPWNDEDTKTTQVSR